MRERVEDTSGAVKLEPMRRAERAAKKDDSRRGKPPDPRVPIAAPPAPVRAAGGLCVRIVEGIDAGRWAPLGEADRATRVGSRRGADLVLDDPDVGEDHLALWSCPEGIGVRALDPKRATFIGAVRVLEAVVPPGTRLKVGGSVLTADVQGAAVDLRARLRREGLAYASEPMAQVAEAIARLAPHTTSVLIEGETGTGKEVVARAMHRLGLRANGPFVVVDCGALPENLLESELFGHERGAFTGAERRRVGAFERAHGGTIFLDEIGELPPSQQPALLGVLQRRRFRRVGGDREVEVDVRVIAATNRDLRDEAKSGAFRADLFYRLASVRVHLPPLRDRLSDLPELVAHIAEELTGSPGGVALGTGELEALTAHGFPGNVRELRAMIERLHTMGGLDLGGAPSAPRAPAAAGEGEGFGEEAAEGSLGSYRDARAQTLAAFERAYLRRLIDSCGGNASEAARVARMDRPFLLKLLRRHGLR